MFRGKIRGFGKKGKEIPEQQDGFQVAADIPNLGYWDQNQQQEQNVSPFDGIQYPQGFQPGYQQDFSTMNNQNVPFQKDNLMQNK